MLPPPGPPLGDAVPDSSDRCLRIEARARTGTQVFAGAPGEKILHAGLRHGIALPYECGTGTCGTCRARLVEGRIADGWPEAPGRGSLKRAGEFLMCQDIALGDCVLEVAGAVAIMTPEAGRARRSAAVVGDLIPLTHDVVFVRCEAEQSLEFDAGQFVIVEVPGIAGGRAYSMVNFARPARSLDFVIKMKPGGRVSEWLSGAAVAGARLMLFGPLGRATFAPGLAAPLLCVAGGSGIAGMMSILSCAAEARHFDRFPGHLFFGVRRVRDLFFLDELAAFRRRFAATLRLTVALSEEAVAAELAEQWPDLAFDTGLVHEVAARHLRGSFDDDVRAYVAGPPPMVDATIRMLLKEGRLPPARIRYDKFS